MMIVMMKTTKTNHFADNKLPVPVLNYPTFYSPTTKPSSVECDSQDTTHLKRVLYVHRTCRNSSLDCIYETPSSHLSRYNILDHFHLLALWQKTHHRIHQAPALSCFGSNAISLFASLISLCVSLPVPLFCLFPCTLFSVSLTRSLRWGFPISKMIKKGNMKYWICVFLYLPRAYPLTWILTCLLEVFYFTPSHQIVLLYIRYTSSQWLLWDSLVSCRT